MVTSFLPAMMSVVVDDNIFTVEQKLPSEEKSSQVYPTLLPEAFYRYVTLPLGVQQPSNPSSRRESCFFLCLSITSSVFGLFQVPPGEQGGL